MVRYSQAIVIFALLSITTSPSQGSDLISPEIRSRGDYVCDEDFEIILDRLYQESLDSISAKNYNWVDDKISDENVEEMFDLANPAYEEAATERPFRELMKEALKAGQGASKAGRDFECPICLEKVESDNLASLTCEHSFHALCLFRWKKMVGI